MNAQDREAPHGEDVNLSKGAAGEPSQGMSAGAEVSPTSEGSASEPGAGALPNGVRGADQQSRPQSEEAHAAKLQHAMENLVGRIAEARSRGAARAHDDAVGPHKLGSGHSYAAIDGAQASEMSDLGWEDGKDPPRPPRSERHLAALELRMRHIAELAGTPLAEDISADIAVLRGKMDRLSRADGVLSNRMETIQRQLSQVRESLDTSSTPVVDRLMELETRLDEIGEALASRQLSVEARAAVEHSCSHILGAIARIEGLAMRAAVPEGAWDQLSAVRARIDRLPTIDSMAGLERRIRDVSERLGEVADRSDRSQEMANLERRLSEIGAATKAAVDEIRERPAYDPADVRNLLHRIEAWRSEKPSSVSPVVGIKLDSIARQVDQLSKSDHKAALAKIQEGLGQLTGIVSAQNANLSGLDLVGLQNRLARICDELSAEQSERLVEKQEATPSKPSNTADFHGPHEDDEDHELAKQLAVRFAPHSPPVRRARPVDEPDVGDVSGAFNAVQEALESLVGQIPFVDQHRETPRGASAPRTPAGASSSPERPSLGEPRRFGAGGGTPPVLPQAPEKTGSATARPSALASSIGSTAPAEPSAAAAEPVGTKHNPPVEENAFPADRASTDAAHRIGRYSTWRKAKVAVVAANTPKY